MKPFIYKNSILHLDEIDLEPIIKKHGTPVFIAFRHIAEQVLAAASEITSANSGKTKLFISVKTNDDTTWLRECCKKGFGIEVVSRQELEHVVDLGCSASGNIIYNGPAKTMDDLEFCISNKAGIINIDAYSEALRIKKICEHKNQKQVVGIRLCLDPNSRWNKFGIIPGSEEWNNTVDVIKSCALMELEGLHFHEAVTMASENSFHDTAKKIMKQADVLIDSGFNIRWIDFGGGKLPNDYDVDELLKLKKWVDNAPSGLKKFEIYLELGKALVNDVFVLAAKCITRKIRNDKKLLIFDAGVNVVAGRHANMQYPRYYPLHEKLKEKTASMLCGPMCFPTDMIEDNVMLPDDLGEEDILVIPSCGAYTLTLRWKGIVKQPPVVWV